MTAQELITQIRDIFKRHTLAKDAIYMTESAIRMAVAEMFRLMDSVEGEREGEG